jgi:2-oxoglutarate/2-oxoacid ferredoxin oxidoreductase subunit alpha
MLATEQLETTNRQNETMSPVEERRNSTAVNCFTLMIATKNGSGSQTANALLLRSLFRMGIPVNGKNLFPSNIKGLPTWYAIRLSRDGYSSREASPEIVVAMNLDTAAEDIQNLPSGGVCILPQEWNWTQSRADIVYYPVPVKQILEDAAIDDSFRDRVNNMVYVGVLAQLLGIPLDVIRPALTDTFGGKAQPVATNFAVIQQAHDWTRTHIEKRDPFCIMSMDGTAGKILLTGNEAAALGALFGGVTVVAWYPITPSTSIIDTILAYQYLRQDRETGENTVAVLQTEDEMAALGTIIGAGWAGARAMTATSGPGISLMAEFAGLAYAAEIPCVIWDITRVGPSTGLPTRTSQGDILFAHLLGHGDTCQVCLIPGSIEECFEFGWRAFDLADQLQTPIFVLSDLDLGMNLWMSESLAFPDQPINRGKTLNKEALNDFIAQHGEWYRYTDYDGDGVCYRTLPGTEHPRAAYFTRGTGHTARGAYSERSDDWLKNSARLKHKQEVACLMLPRSVVDCDLRRPVGIISYGSNDPAVQEARDRLATKGLETNYLRIRALPLAQEVTEFVLSHERVYVVENNTDGQMHKLLRMEIPQDNTHMISLASGDTLPMTAPWVYEQILAKEGK